MSFLIGIVIAQQGAAQLRQFGAEIYTINLTGRLALRELGVLMTAIMVAGRSGSAFAAQLGTMKLTEEIDAMRTIGVSPMEALVIPRIMAAVLMMPLLGFFAAMLAVIGGAFIADLTLGIPFLTFLSRIQEVVPIHDLWVGADQGAGVRADRRAGGLLPGHAGQGQFRGSRPAHDHGGGPGDLHGDRARRVLRGVLRQDRLGLMGEDDDEIREDVIDEARDDVIGQFDGEFPIEIEGLRNSFGEQVIHEDLSLQVRRGEILGVVGGSGTGKSVLMRSIIGLQIPDEGEIRVFGKNTIGAEPDEESAVRSRWGVLFQGGALFSTLTVAENVEVPLKQFYPELDEELRHEIARYKVVMSRPARGRGGQVSVRAVGRHEEARRPRARARARSRAAVPRRADRRARPDRRGRVRRADPQAADTLGLTVFLITHDLDTLYAICDRVAVLADGKVIAVGTIPELLETDHPWIQEYFNGPRSRAAQATLQARPREIRGQARQRGKA